ncbi:MAG: hypothetical protein WCE44_11220 [Candidatus Velthaea sp.]|jgi:hypothetical protein
MRSLFRGALAIAATVALLGSAPGDEASELIANSAARMAPLHSYTFQIHVDFALKTFPYIRFHLDGDGSFVKPDLLSIHFRHVPWFGKGFENISLDPLEPSTWKETYDFTGVQRIGDRLHLEMKDRTTGHLKNVNAELDEDGLRRVQWNYLNGGWIAVEVNPVHVDGFPLPKTENAEIKLPGYHVEAHATFEDYKLETDTSAHGGG